MLQVRSQRAKEMIAWESKFTAVGINQIQTEAEIVASILRIAERTKIYTCIYYIYSYLLVGILDWLVWW